MIIGCHRLIAPIIVDRGFSLVVKPTRRINYDDRKCQIAPETANIMNETGALFGLFLSAFLAATILPAQSELGLGYLVITSQYSMGCWFCLPVWQYAWRDRQLGHRAQHCIIGYAN